MELRSQATPATPCSLTTLFRLSATCTETPAISSGQVSITYTGAADTGGSGLLAVGLYEIDSGQYTLLDAKTGSTNTFTLNYTGNGTVNNLVLIAWDNAGNPSADKPVPAFIIDQTLPTDPRECGDGSRHSNEHSYTCQLGSRD